MLDAIEARAGARGRYIDANDIPLDQDGLYWRLFNAAQYLQERLVRECDHSCGVVWHNVGGTEPDMRCQNCGRDLA